MTNSNTNIDDYYSNIQSLNENDNNEKKTSLKLKIKVKKAEDEIPAISNETESNETIVVDNAQSKNTQTFKLKKQPSIITFEKSIPVVKSKEQYTRPEIKKEFQHTRSQSENKPFFKKEFTRPSISFEKREPQSNREIKEPTVNTTEKIDNSIDSQSLERFSTNKKSQEFKPKTFNNTSTSASPQKKVFNFEPRTTTPIDDAFGKKFKSKKTLKTKWFFDEDDSTFRRSKKQFANEKKEKNIDDIKQNLTDKTWQDVFLPDFLTVKEFSEKIWVPLSKIIGEFLKNWMMATLNTRVDFDTCFIIAETFNIHVVRDQKWDVSISSVIEWNIVDLLKNDDPEKLITRAPIISIMWHVDHGKTSILDYIRKTSVASGEAGWITQKIWAYQVEKKWKKITFLDTPWHEAFSIMRARWAKLTDIAIIVVAADEWMKPQTIESINHAKEAWVPIIVAVNKMDKQGANLDFVKWQLAEQWLQPEDWWWDTVVVPVSAHTWMWIDELLDMILLVAEMQDFKADPTRPAIATVIESHLDSRLWPLATILVNSWTLKKWACVVCASTSGRLKFIKDYRWRNIDEAKPSTPVLISWLSSVVEWWDILQVTPDVETAKQKAQEYELTKSSKSLSHFEWASLELLLNRIKTGNLKQLKVVVKSESNWSLEALKDALHKLWTNEIKIQIIHSWVWDINESDVIMSGTSQAILVGYNVWIVWNAKNTLQNSKIEVINKKVIYHILEKLESIITWMIDIKHDDMDLWEAKVKAIFFTSKDRMVVGCELVSWKVESKAKIRVVRDSKKAWSWELAWLKHWVMDVNEILEGEFWIAFKWDVKLEVWDLLEFYKVVQRK